MVSLVQMRIQVTQALLKKVRLRLYSTIEPMAPYITAAPAACQSVHVLYAVSGARLLRRQHERALRKVSRPLFSLHGYSAYWTQVSYMFIAALAQVLREKAASPS